MSDAKEVHVRDMPVYSLINVHPMQIPLIFCMVSVALILGNVIFLLS